MANLPSLFSTQIHISLQENENNGFKILPNTFKTIKTMANLDKKKSPQPGKIKLKISGNNAVASDSDASGDTNSLSAESATEQAQPAQTSRKKQRRRSSEWEIMEGLKVGQRFENKPDAFSGFLHKKRKWPLKGWHKVKGYILYCLFLKSLI